MRGEAGMWWEAEGSQSVWTFGTKTADSISMPICLVSSLNQTWPSQADDSRGLRPREAFSPKPDTRKLRRVLAWHMHAFMGKQVSSAQMWIFIHKHVHPGWSRTTGKESVLIYCKEVIQRIEMRPDRLWRANPHSRWLCFFLSHPSWELIFCALFSFSPFEFVSIKRQQNPIQQNK